MIRLKPGVCYDKSKLYKPEWAYSTPKGYRADRSSCRFVLCSCEWRDSGELPLALGYGCAVGFQGCCVSPIGTAQGVNSPGYNVGTPGLVRIRDTEGNPLTNDRQNQDCVLAFGAVGQSGFNGINASGFPFGLGVDCERGGVITFDFILPSVAVPASLLIFPGFSVQAKVGGVGGNAITVAFVQAGLNTPLSVTVVGNAITVNLATDGGGSITSSYSDTAAAIVLSAAASALVTVICRTHRDVGQFVCGNQSCRGAAVSYVNVQGTILGDKLFEECAA